MHGVDHVSVVLDRQPREDVPWKVRHPGHEVRDSHEIDVGFASINSDNRDRIDIAMVFTAKWGILGEY